MSEHDLISDLQQTTRVIKHLIASGAQVREIRVHGRARQAIVLNRPPGLSGNTYAWGIDHQGRQYERHACFIDGVQIQWETQSPTLCNSNIVPFPGRSIQPRLSATVPTRS